MGVALLAPVPRNHLDSALKICQEQGKTSFGTNALGAFEKLEQEFQIEGIPVYICATKHGPPNRHAEDGKVTLRGVLCNVIYLDKPNKHPNPMYRPERTRDEDWQCYWEVRDLRILRDEGEDPIPLPKFTALAGNKPLSERAPRRPLLVKGAFIPGPD